MTLVLTVNGPETIWLVVDRRLSYKDRPPRDDARKLMFLETPDAVAILGYAGLGVTALGTEPADWMSAVLRGRNLPLEQSLGVLAEAIKSQLRRHLVQLTVGAPAHDVIITAFVGGEPRLYTIDMALAPDRKKDSFRYTRHVFGLGTTNPRTPRIATTGSGGLYLLQNQKMKWMRSILRVVQAHDRCRISSGVVADILARVNYDVHLGIADKSVGPRCIVAWRHKEDGVHRGGGGQQFYDGTIADSNSAAVPIIGNGIDLSAFFEVLAPHRMKTLEAMRSGGPGESDTADLVAKLNRLPNKPDEDLR